MVEDDKRINEVISDFLKMNGFKVENAYDGMQGLELFNKEKFDLVILDIMMPKLDGFTLARSIRRKGNTPIIILTARDSQEDQIMGYEIEIDDYLTKPFNPEMLVIKVKNLLKRISKYKDERCGEEYRYGDFKINFTQRRVLIENSEVELEPKQFEILEYLVRNRNAAISREQILDKVWGVDYFGSDRVVDTQVKKLRKKLGLKAHLIKTVFSVGYTFEEKNI